MLVQWLYDRPWLSYQVSHGRPGTSSICVIYNNIVDAVDWKHGRRSSGTRWNMIWLPLFLVLWFLVLTMHIFKNRHCRRWWNCRTATSGLFYIIDFKNIVLVQRLTLSFGHGTQYHVATTPRQTRGLSSTCWPL